MSGGPRNPSNRPYLAIGVLESQKMIKYPKFCFPLDLVAKIHLQNSFTYYTIYYAVFHPETTQIGHIGNLESVNFQKISNISNFVSLVVF